MRKYVVGCLYKISYYRDSYPVPPYLPLIIFKKMCCGWFLIEIFQKIVVPSHFLLKSVIHEIFNNLWLVIDRIDTVIYTNIYCLPIIT